MCLFISQLASKGNFAEHRVLNLSLSLSLSHECRTTCFVHRHNCLSLMINNASFPLSWSFCPSLSLSCLSTCLFCTLTIILANTSHQPIIISQSYWELYVVSITWSHDLMVICYISTKPIQSQRNSLSQLCCHHLVLFAWERPKDNQLSFSIDGSTKDCPCMNYQQNMDIYRSFDQQYRQRFTIHTLST